MLLGGAGAKHIQIQRKMKNPLMNNVIMKIEIGEIYIGLGIGDRERSSDIVYLFSMCIIYVVHLNFNFL